VWICGEFRFEHACGYVQTIARQELITAALRYDAMVEILFRPGQFVREGDAIARVLAAERIKVIERIILQSRAPKYRRRNFTGTIPRRGVTRFMPSTVSGLLGLNCSISTQNGPSR
jgi:Predicted membrane protein (DUF2254)